MAVGYCTICDKIIGCDFNEEYIANHCLDCLDSLDEIDVDLLAIKARNEFERSQFEDYLADRAWSVKRHLHNKKPTS